MRAVLLRPLLLALLAAPLLAQDTPSARDGIEKNGFLVQLRWRRDAAGNLECAAPGQNVFKPLFDRGLLGAVGAHGLLGWIVPVMHGGDLLSLTDGEAHLRRIGVDTATAALATFVRSPIPEELADLAMLDRLVAVDVLLQRDGLRAARIRADLAADDRLASGLRLRVGNAEPVPARLDPATMPLPERADAWVIVDRARLRDGRWLAALARDLTLLSGPVAGDIFEEPLPEDYRVEQAVSETITELPFELVRQFGQCRFDHSCFAIADLLGTPTVAFVSAGEFSPEGVARGLARQGIDGLRTESGKGTTTCTWPGGVITVSGQLLTWVPKACHVAPRPELAAALLQPGGAAVRIRIPERSPLLASIGAAEVLEIDATLAPGDVIVGKAVMRTRDDAAAARAAAWIDNATNQPALWAALGIRLDEKAGAKVSGNTVSKQIALPAEALTYEQLRKVLFSKTAASELFRQGR